MQKSRSEKAREWFRRRTRRVTVGTLVSSVAVPQALNALFSAALIWYAEAELTRTEQIGLFLLIYMVLALGSVPLARAWRWIWPKAAPPGEHDEFIVDFKNRLAEAAKIRRDFPQPRALPPSAPPKKCDRSADELLDIFKGKTHFQATQDFKRYEGMSLEVLGRIDDVSASLGGSVTLRRPDGRGVMCMFDGKTDQLSKLNVGVI